MDRAAALAALNQGLLEEFSRRTTRALRAVLPLRLVLPRIEPFLALNVAKEVRKDALVIACAARALAEGGPPGGEPTERLLAEARAIDRRFLGEVARFPVRIEIPYARLEPLRRQRIERGLELAGRVLEGWSRRRRLRESVPREELEHRLDEILGLYARETQALSQSVKLPGLLGALRARLAQELLGAMHAAAARTAADAARRVHRRRRAAMR